MPEDGPVMEREEHATITGRLDPGESIVMSARQSRLRPGGAALVTPNTVFLTERRVIIRNPQRLGFGEHIEEYWYRRITNVRLEKGIFSASLIFAIPGLTEISKANRESLLWGRDAVGTIDAIPKEAAERMYEYVRKRIAECAAGRDRRADQDDPVRILKARYARGEISKEEFDEIRKDLE